VPGICAECALAKGQVCCDVAEGERLATLTLADIDRIEAATGWPARRFVSTEELDPAVRLGYETLRPLYRGMFVSGLRHELKAWRGACALLERGRGCRLPAEAKPLACRLYPLDFDLAGRVVLLDAPHCLALERATRPGELLRMLGTSQRALRRLRRQALADASDHIRRLRRASRAGR